MNTKEPLREALAKWQAEITDPARTREGQVGNQRYKYAPIEDWLPAVRKSLAQAGFAITQTAVRVDGAWAVQTNLAHVSGETTSGLFPLPEHRDSKAQGAAFTYARRYGLLGLLCLVPDGADTDGGAASGLALLLADTGCTLVQINMWRKANGKPPVDETWDTQALTRLRLWLTERPHTIDTIRKLSP